MRGKVRKRKLERAILIMRFIKNLLGAIQFMYIISFNVHNKIGIVIIFILTKKQTMTQRS